MTSRWKRIAARSMRSVNQARKKHSKPGSVKQCQCAVCGHRFLPWHKRAPDICRECGNLALEIARVAGAEFVTEKAVLAARSRQLLSQPILAGATVSRNESLTNPQS